MTTTSAPAATTPAPAIPFGPQLIGRIEKSLNAFLQLQLAGTGIEETQWVTLNLTAASNATLTRGQLVARVAGVLKTGEITADANIAVLEAAGLAEVRADGAVDLTDTGRATVGRIRGASGEFTQKLWGDLPTED
ncbi:MAG: hypothetical protein ACRDP7_41340, partial [Trebonia sp.]